MNRHVQELSGILDEEGICLVRLYELEEKKTDAVIHHDGKLLEKISIEQEGILDRMTGLEALRMERMGTIRGSGRIFKSISTLADLIDLLDGPSASSLRDRGVIIKESAARLERRRETNRRLIHDNMEYYNILLAGLRRQQVPDRGYGRDGREEEGLRNSILFNHTA